MLLQASFHQTVLEANKAIAPHLKAGKMPDLSNGQDETLRAHFRMMLNHHEFVAAALRNGDFDERLLRDSERSAVTSLFKCCEEYIWNLRSSRDRVAIYEHLEWLYTRWETSPPGPVQRTLERMKGTPFYGSRNPQKRK